MVWMLTIKKHAWTGNSVVSHTTTQAVLQGWMLLVKYQFGFGGFPTSETQG